MTVYKLVSKGGSILARSSNRDYLSDLRKQHDGSHIVKVTSEKTTATTSQTKRSVFSKRSTLSRQKAYYPPTRGSITIMPSSWIRNIKYDVMTGELHINMRGKWYGPWYVDGNTYRKFIMGQAVPSTTDSRRPARWAKNLGPSLGAAFWKYIKIGGAQPLGLTLEEQVARKYKLLGQIA